MNHLLANIYGTGGVDLEKTAGVENAPKSLSDLALMIAVENDGDDLEKVASVHDSILDNLVAFDRAGRSIAHQEFYEMEKAAAEGDSSALESFFADQIETEDTAEEEEDYSDLKSAILQEIGRRSIS